MKALFVLTPFLLLGSLASAKGFELMTNPVGSTFLNSHHKAVRAKFGKNTWEPQAVKTLTSPQKLKFKGVTYELFAQTEVHFAGEELLLKKGSLRINFDEPPSRFVIIKTPVAQIRFFGKDVLAEYEVSRARVQVSVFKGEAYLRGLEREDELMLVEGHQGRFLGMVEEGEPVFDILLKGRKVARGELSSVIPLKETEVSILKKNFNVVDYIPPVFKGITRKPGQICSSPLAKMNQCAWFCEGNPKNEKKKCMVERQDVQCIRRRCNALGDWADETRLPSSLRGACETSLPMVRPCDY